jgi:hypothetical protein
LLIARALSQAISLFSRSSPSLPKEIRTVRVHTIDSGWGVGGEMPSSVGVCCHNMQARCLRGAPPFGGAFALWITRSMRRDISQDHSRINRRRSAREQTSSAQLNAEIAFVFSRSLVISTEVNTSPSELVAFGFWLNAFVYPIPYTSNFFNYAILWSCILGQKDTF